MTVWPVRSIVRTPSGTRADADGATTVIGGVMINEERQLQDRVPALHRMPLLGWLFKRNTSIDDSRELLIFITPRILKG